MIQEEEGWWYLGCKKCSKKVVKESEFVDLDDDTKGKSIGSADKWRCTKCNEIVNGIRSMYVYKFSIKHHINDICTINE